MATEMGVDEAGRGPVIGPMVMAGVIVDEALKKELKDAGVKDSKKVLPNKREKLFHLISSKCKHHIIIISPKEIDAALSDTELNLNMLEAIKTAELINILRPDVAIVDSPSNNVLKYASHVRKHVGDSLRDTIKIIAENKADENYVSSSAASILAKVTRDREIEKLKKELNVDFGSGYASDPLTQKFVAENWNNPTYLHIFRETWESFKRLKRGKDQLKLGEF